MRRNHAPVQIIGDKDSRVMKKRGLKNDTCLLCEFDPKSIKYTLEDEDNFILSIVHATNLVILQ